MIRKEDGEFVAMCECGEFFSGGTEEDFRRFVQQLKDAGWKVRKEEDEWLHICPECQCQE